MQKKLIKDVSVDELLELRKDGYANSEIGEMLDVSGQTIWKLIGANPPEISARMRAEGRRKAIDLGGAEPVDGAKATGADAEIRESDSILKVCAHEWRLEGLAAIYGVTGEGVWIRLKHNADFAGGGYSLAIRREDVKELAKELAVIARRLDGEDKQTEVWY